MDREALISHDRMRYTKNKFSALMTYLAILFNAIYFAFIYRGIEVDIGSFYYNITIGISVLVNLFFMLAAFLASENVKNYKMSFAIVLLVLAGLQILRIFYYPIKAHSTLNGTVPVMSDGVFVLCLVCLIASATCLIAGGVVGILRTKTLNEHYKYIGESGCKLDFGEEENHVPIVEATTNTNLDASVMGEEPIKSEKDD